LRMAAARVVWLLMIFVRIMIPCVTIMAIIARIPPRRSR
jgi:hypothetical protein